MTIEEIVNRDSHTYEVAEMIFLVEQYIKDKKDVSVDINMMKAIPTQDMNNPIAQMVYQDQVMKLHKSFDYAYKHFKK